MGWRRWDVLGAAVVALALVTAGCGGGEVDGAAPTATTVAPSTTTEPTPATTVPTDEQAVLAALDGYWRSYFEANDPPNPDHPGLASFSDGEALRISRENASRRRDLGQAVRLAGEGSFRRETIVEDLSNAKAVAIECVIDGSLLVDVPSGAVLNDAVNTVHFRFTLESGEQGWKVVDSVVEETARDEASCG